MKLELIVKTDESMGTVVELTKDNPAWNTAGMMDSALNSTNYIYSDKAYSMIMDSYDNVYRVDVYANDNYIPTSYAGSGQIVFQSNIVFDQYYGFVQIIVKVYKKHENDENDEIFYSNYLPVLNADERISKSVVAMTEYVYDFQKQFLLNGENNVRDAADFKKSEKKNLDVELYLAEEIATIYENSYGYFKANARFKTSKIEVVDRTDKLQFVSPKSISYIAQNPSLLRQSAGNSGIRISKHNFIPEKTLMDRNVYSKEIDENKVILGFLKTVLERMTILKHEIDIQQSKIPLRREINEYSYSPFYLLMTTGIVLKDRYEKAQALEIRLTRLWNNYKSIFNFETKIIMGIPKPSPIFMTVPQYNRIYTGIREWYNLGLYDLEKEKYMLSFVRISDLYENYFLLKVINQLVNMDYELIDVKRFIYRMSVNFKYRNTSCNNTFVLKKNEVIVTIYYQPVIQNDGNMIVNDLELYRNNSVSMSNDDEPDKIGRYYVPDFVIKITKDTQSDYIILDTKFSTDGIVRNCYMPKLSYKYLFSLSSINSNSRIIGLGIVHGKCQENSINRSFYDNELQGLSIEPFAEVIPFMASVNEDVHGRQIASILRKSTLFT